MRLNTLGLTSGLEMIPIGKFGTTCAHYLMLSSILLSCELLLSIPLSMGEVEHCFSASKMIKNEGGMDLAGG